MSSTRKVFAATLSVSFLFCLAHTAPAETIFGAMAEAYRNNPDLNAARAGLRATDEGVTIAKAGWRPKVNAEVDLTIARNEGRRLPSTVARALYESETGLTVTQPIFDGFQTLNNVRAAESNGTPPGRTV